MSEPSSMRAQAMVGSLGSRYMEAADRADWGAPANTGIAPMWTCNQSCSMACHGLTAVDGLAQDRSATVSLQAHDEKHGPCHAAPYHEGSVAYCGYGSARQLPRGWLCSAEPAFGEPRRARAVHPPGRYLGRVDPRGAMGGGPDRLERLGRVLLTGITSLRQARDLPLQ